METKEYHVLVTIKGIQCSSEDGNNGSVGYKVTVGDIDNDDGIESSEHDNVADAFHDALTHWLLEEAFNKQ